MTNDPAFNQEFQTHGFAGNIVAMLYLPAVDNLLADYETFVDIYVLAVKDLLPKNSVLLFVMDLGGILNL